MNLTYCESCRESGEYTPATTHARSEAWSGHDLCEECARQIDARELTAPKMPTPHPRKLRQGEFAVWAGGKRWIVRSLEAAEKKVVAAQLWDSTAQIDDHDGNRV